MVIICMCTLAQVSQDHVVIFAEEMAGEGGGEGEGVGVVLDGK